MNQTVVNILFYAFTAIIITAVMAFYLLRKKRESKTTTAKLRKSIHEGLHEPVSLHPRVDPSRCLGSGACVAACPEKDILGLRNGRAIVINASRCIGHGACFQACPTEAISLIIGTEKRGVDLPFIDKNFETNVRGIFIAGELGGMGLIRNAVEQGKQAVDNIAASLRNDHGAEFDLIITGAGPAGISAALAAKKKGLKFLLLEQDTLGGAVFTYPRTKIVMTAPMDLPLHGKIKLTETSKTVLLRLWESLIREFEIPLIENCKVDSISGKNGCFNVVSSGNRTYTAATVLLATGRRGTPRKLGIPGEELEKVAYRLIEPELISGKEILIVGGGDSAVEAALLLAGRNHVTVSYRGEVFSRIKPMNTRMMNDAVASGKIKLVFKSNLIRIENDSVVISAEQGTVSVGNDLVFIFAGGELPTRFLEKSGISIKKMHGHAILKH